MRFVRLLVVLAAFGCQPADAQTLFHLAEDRVPVAVVRIIQGTQHTEVHLQMQAASVQVCWAPSGPDAPYLLSSGRRYRFLGGEPIAECPRERNYQERDIVVLRFEPLADKTCEFSLIEGEAGERQMAGRQSVYRYWNFLGVKLCASISGHGKDIPAG